MPEGTLLPLALVADFLFNPLALVALDLSEYNPDIEARLITLCLTHGYTKIFEGPAADQMYRWFLEATGQAKITVPQVAGVKQ